MKQTLKKLLPILLLIAVGCAQTPGGSPKEDPHTLEENGCALKADGRDSEADPEAEV